MKKRVLSLILAVLMVLSVLPVMTLSIAAEEQPEASAPAAEFSYNDLYVTDGLVAWFRAEDVNGEQPGTDAKDNEIYIVGLSYEEDGTLKTGQVQYKKDFLDDLGNGTPGDHNFGEDVTAQIVMSDLAVNDKAPLLNVGVSSVVPYNNALAHRIASWNVLDSQNNSVFWDVGDDVNKLGTQSRLFAFTQKIDVTLDQYKYVDGAYKNANGETLNLGFNGSSYYYYVPNPLVKRAVFEAYLTVEGADQNNPENYASVKQYNEKKWSFAAVRRDSAQAFQTALGNAGITGFAVNTDLAKVIPAETDDLPFDGHMRLDEYLDGARLAFRGYAYNPAIPFTYGSYGDEFADENGEILTPEQLAVYDGEKTNTNETVWDGKSYKTGAESNFVAEAAVGDLAWGNANLFVGRSQAKLHDFRLYNKLLSEAEMKQNAFADLAKHRGLDKTALAILVKLSEEADRQEIYALFASYNLASDVDAGTLDGILRPAVSKKYIALYDAQTEEEQTFKELFNGTDVDLCDFAVLDDFAKKIFLAKLANDDAREATQVYFDNLLKASSLDYSGYETVRKMFKEDLFDIYVASDDQADIDKAEAVYAGINFAEFDELSDSLKATVEAAMKDDLETLKTYAIAGDSVGAQAWLDAKVDEAAEAIYSNYDVLYVKDDLYSHLSFLEVSKDELTGDKLDEWRNLGRTNDGAANALLQSYDREGNKEYTFSGNGAYYINTDGEAVLFPTYDKPTTLVDGKLNSVRGNTFQFEDGYIVSPYHLGYYQDADGEKFELRSQDSSPNLSANANWVPGHQGELNTYIKLPVADSFFNKKDVTVQYVISYANQIVDGVLKGNIDDETARRNRYTDFIYTPFGVTGITWFDTANYKPDASWAFGFREYVNGSWKQKEYLSGMDGSWPKGGDYQIDDTKDFGVAKTYTFVSELAAITVSSGDACVDGGNEYTAKTNLDFYIDDEIALGADYFGSKKEDGLLWLGAAAPNGHSIGSGGGLGLYAVRIYKRALTEDEILQNRFADIATFYHLDLETYYKVAEADRMDAIKAFIDSLEKPDFSYATEGSGKSRKSSEVEALYEAAFAVETLTYLDFYVTEGLITHLNFLKATDANNTPDWENVIIPKVEGGYTYSDFSKAEAILNTYDLTGCGGYKLASTYGRYFKTESGGYALKPTEKDPAVVDGSGYLLTYPGNTFKFGDGYIWSPYREAGYYKDSSGNVNPISVSALSTINVSESPEVSKNEAVSLKEQRHQTTWLYLPRHDEEPYLPSSTQNGTYQFVAAFSIGVDGTVSNANSNYKDWQLKIPHGDVAINKNDEYSRFLYRRAGLSSGVWSNSWTDAVIYRAQLSDFAEVITWTSMNEIVDHDIPAEYIFENGSNKYVARAKYTFYRGFDTEWITPSRLDQPVKDGYRWLTNRAPNANNVSEVGFGGGMKIYAIRVYDRAITMDEMIQNQFADVVGFYHLDANVMLDIPEILWKQVYPIFEGVKLDDATQTKEALQSVLDAKVAELADSGDAVEVLKFEGYQARNEEYDGLRALYTVNEDKLAELKGLGYSVEFGAILAIADGRTADAIVGSVVDGDFALTVDKALSVKVYDGDRYTGKHFINDVTGETQFAYTLTFNAENAIEENFESEVIFRSYVVITKNGESTVVYPDNSSESFDDGLSYQKVAKKYYDLGLGYNKIVQKALAECGDIKLTGKTYTINGNDLAEYTIVSAPDTLKFALSVREEIKKATGYTLPIVKEAEAAGLAINVAHNTKLNDGAWAVSFDDDAVIIGGHGVAETKQAVSEFIASFPESGGAIPTQQIAQNTEVALAGYSVVAEEGVTPSFVNQLKEAIQAKGISLDGTSGKTITICAPDAVKFYSDAYKISLVDGEDIVIEGGSQEMIGEAIELLITTLTDTGFYMSSIGYEKNHVYEQADLAINGELVKDYKIVANTNVFGAKVAADYLQKKIQEKTGRKLSIVSQTSGPAFVIDIKTNDEGKYFIDSEGSTITLSGAGANGAYTAAKALVNEIGDETSLTVADSSAAMFTLENTAYLLKNGETLKAAMWGDSVGEASGCIAPAVLLKEKLSQAFPGANVTMNNASLGGRHTAWGVYHIDEAIIDKGDLDLVMISLGTNDAHYAIKYEQTLLNYQSMIEKIRKANPNADIVFLMYGRIEEVYAMKNGNAEVAYMKAMFEIADYYDIPIVDTVHKMDELTGASKNKDHTTNAAWQTYYRDMVHPNQDGYNLYADIYYQSIKAAIDASAGTKMEEHAMPTPKNKNSKIDTQRYYADLEEVPATAELIGLTYEDGWAQNGWSYAENSTASFTFTGTGLELYLENSGEPKYKVVITDEEGAVVFDSGEKTYNSWWYDPQLTLSYGTYNVVVTHLNGSAENKLRITYINVVGATKTPQPTYLDTNLPDTLSDLSTNYDGSPMTADSVLERFEASREEIGEEVTVIKEVSIADYPEVLNKKQVFVSATIGNDANEGTVTKPFATLGAALAAMENEGGGIIWVEGGKYATTRPVVINSKHSGTKETPLFIIGYGADPVVFVGGKIIDSTSFKKVDPATDEVAARLKASVQDKVYSVDLSSWTREDVVLAGGKIIINDETYDLARFPNAYTDAQRTQNIDNTSLPYVSYAWDKGSMSDTASTQYQEWVDRVNNSNGTLTLDSEIPFDIELANASGASYDVSEIYNWVNTGNIFISGSVYAHWHSKSYQLSADCVHNGNKLGLDKGAGRYSIKSVKPEQYGAKAHVNNHLYIYNAIEALDAPGEWFIDIDTMKLYVYPTENAGDITSAEVLYTGKVPTPENGEYKTNESGVITFRGEGTHKGVTEPVEYVVIDNIDIGASFSGGYRVNYAKNIVIQNAEVRNTNEEGVHFSRSFDSALIHSVLHRDVKISYYSKVFTTDLVPSNIFIQNNKFYEPAIGRQYAITIEDGVRAVISHNDFKDCCIILQGLEHIIEYNEFQGGSRDVADGGMVYVVDGGKMGYHVRYNVFHMFNTSKRAIYNDRKASGNYAYGNLINVRGSKMGEPLNPWYSSSGHGNVCVENVIVLRNYEEEFLPLDKTTQNGYGDCVFESTLYYYYKDDEKGSGSAASELISGSRMGQKELDLLVNGPVYDSYNELASYSPEAIRKRFPDYVSYLETVRLILAAYNGELGATYEKPTYDVAEAKGVTYTYKAPTDLKIYVPEHQYKLSGFIETAQARTIEASKDTVLTFTYEELSAIERLWRQGAKLVVQDNVIIGGGYVDGGHGGSETKDTAQRKTIRIDAALEKGYIEGMSIIDNNYIEQGVSVMPGIADGGYSASDYEIPDAAWNTIAQSVSSVEGLKKQNYKSAGRTYVEFAE